MLPVFIASPEDTSTILPLDVEPWLLPLTNRTFAPSSKISFAKGPSLTAAPTVIPAPEFVCIFEPVPITIFPELSAVFPVATFMDPALKILTSPPIPVCE